MQTPTRSRQPGTLRRTLLACLALAPWPQTAAGPAPQEPELPPWTAAEIDGQPLSMDEYREYLLTVFGRRPLQDMITLRLLEREGARMGLSVRPEELEEAWRALLDLWLEERFGGKNDALDAELAQQGHTRASYRRVFDLQKRRELLVQRIVLATRQVRDEDVRARFAQVYGADGMRTRVRQIVFTRARTRMLLEREGKSGADLAPAAVEARMLELAAAAQAELQGGIPFETLAAARTHDLAARNAAGLLEAETWRRYGPALIEAVSAAPVGEVRGPILTNTGAHLFRVEDREQVAFEGVRASLREELLAAPATPEETEALLARLRAAAKIRTF